MKMTDGTRTVEIRMCKWTDNGYTPDFSNDFFDAGKLPLVHIKRLNEEVYQVDDVEYCIDQAMDWKASEGDFWDDEPDECNIVFVKDL